MTLANLEAAGKLREEMITHCGLVVGAVFIQLAAASSAVFTAELPPDITAENRLLGLCIAGSILGAFVSVAVMPPQKEVCSSRQLAVHFSASVFAALAFAPLAIEHFNWQPTGPRVLGVSAGIALFSVVTLAAVYPRVVKRLSQWLSDRKVP